MMILIIVKIIVKSADQTTEQREKNCNNAVPRIIKGCTHFKSATTSSDNDNYPKHHMGKKMDMTVD